MFAKFHKFLFKEVNNSGIILWRILFGILLFAEAWGCILTGWLKENFVEPSFRFTFIGFEFLQVLSGEWMYAYAFLMGIFGLMFMLGWKYRFAAFAYFIMWAGMYFGQKSSYNNHYYLILLLLGIMLFIPANAAVSIDSKRKPKLLKTGIPNWTYFILKCQFAIVYVSAVLAKLHLDWLQARPLKIWLAAKSDYFLIGPILKQEATAYIFAYGGIFYDAAIIPLLLFKRTRIIALVLSLVFHLSNSAIFQIGVFPFMAISAIVLFWDAEELQKIFFKRKAEFLPQKAVPSINAKQKVFLGIMLCYLAWQIYLPLRHHFYEGNVNWTEEGHRLAWHMMTRNKSGSGSIEIVDLRTNRKTRVNAGKYLKPHQNYSFYRYPDLVWQFTQFLKAEYAKEGMDSISIYVKTNVSLNGRPRQNLIDPNFDFATYPKWERFKHKKWLVELEE